MLRVVLVSVTKFLDKNFTSRTAVSQFVGFFQNVALANGENFLCRRMSSKYIFPFIFSNRKQ